MKWTRPTQSLGGFEKFRKAAVCFVVSFCLSVRPHGKRWQQSTAHVHCRNAQLRTDWQWCTFSPTAATFPVQLHTTPPRTVVVTSVPTVHRSGAVRHYQPPHLYQRYTAMVPSVTTSRCICTNGTPQWCRPSLPAAASVPTVHRSGAVRHCLPAATSSSSRRAAVPTAYRSRLYQMLDNRP